MLLKTINIHSKPTKKVGFVLKPHGFNGALRISLDESSQLKDYLLLEINGKFVPFKIQSYNTNASIVKLIGIENMEAAEELANLSILEIIDAVETNQESIIGYTLVDKKSNKTFVITNIVEYPGNILIEFRNEFKDTLLPWHEDFIVSINHAKQLITADFPEGLLEL